MSLMLSLLVGSTLAGPADPIAAGEDLVAWRALQDETDPVAWRGFVLEYPDSPLAELAWRRLAEVGHAPDASANPGLRRIATSYEHHEADLARTPEGIAVAPLRLEPTAEEAAPEVRVTRRPAPSFRLPTVLTSTRAPARSWALVVEPMVEESVEAPLP